MGAYGDPSCYIDGEDSLCGMAPKPLTIRDHMALAAVIAVLRQRNVSPAPRDLAEFGYAVADAMLEEREKK